MMYVLQTLSGKERDVVRELQRKGYAVYLPREICMERRGRQWHERERILLPGYVFIDTALTAGDYYKITRTGGIIRILGNPRPQPLSQSEADYIYSISGGGKPLAPSTLRVDDKVTVLSGSLVGQEAQILKLLPRQRKAVVRLSLLGKEYQLTLSVDIIQN